MIKEKKPFYSRWWFILIVIIVIIGAFNSIKNGIENASDKKVTYTWPNSTLASMIPQPDSKYGRIIMESEEHLNIEIYKVSKESFEQYIEDCKSSGFTVDYSKYDTYYMADNKDGYSLLLNYDDDEKTLEISLNIPDEPSSENEIKDISSTEETEKNTNSEEDTDKEDTSAENTDSEGLNETKETEEANNTESKDETDNTASDTSDNASTDIRPEFKEILDEYEEFMNEYCDFMKKYTNSTDTASMMTDYLRLLKEETEWLEKIDKLDDEEINAAEAKYYAEVTYRVSQKLIEAAQ